MARPAQQHFVRVDLALLSLDDQTTTVTVKATSRRVEGGGSVTEYRPLVLAVGRLGARMGVTLPQPGGSSIVFDDDPGTFGVERRLSDLFARYTPMGQPVRVYTAAVAPGMGISDGDWTQIWQGTCNGWTAGRDGARHTVTVQVAAAGIPQRFLGYTLPGPDVFPSIPAGNVGKGLPLVIGAGVQIKPFFYYSNSATTKAFAYASTFGRTFVNGGLAAPFFRHTDGRYVEFTSASAVGTPVIDQVGTVSASRGEYYLDTIGLAQQVPASVSTFLVTQVRLRLMGWNSGSWDCNSNFRVSLYVNDGKPGPSTEVAFAEADKLTYRASLRGAASFDVYLNLNKPVLVGPGTGQTHFLVFTQAVDKTKFNTPGTYDLIDPVGLSGGGATEWLLEQPKPSGGDGKIWKKYTGLTNVLMHYGLHGVQITDVPDNPVDSASDGWLFSYFTASVNAADANQPDVQIDNLDLVAAVNGIQDDSGGTITGTPNATITLPDHAINLLSRKWNGSAWVADAMHMTTYDYSHLAGSGDRSLKGALPARPLLAQALDEVCRASCSRLAYVNVASSSAYLAPWVWGARGATQAVLTDEEWRVRTVEQGGFDTVVNDVTIGYDRRLTITDVVVSAQQQEFKDYAGYLILRADGTSGPGRLCAASRTLYGARPNANPRHDLIGDELAAATLARFLAGVYAHPWVYVDLSGPLEKYKALKLLDVVELKHPAVMAFFGTSACARVPHYQGTPLPNFWNGSPAKRAQRYRAQIEGREVALGDDGAPTLELTVRLLLSEFDPT